MKYVCVCVCEGVYIYVYIYAYICIHTHTPPELEPVINTHSEHKYIFKENELDHISYYPPLVIQQTFPKKLFLTEQHISCVDI